jgi:Protein of unknown function (DUF1571)
VARFAPFSQPGQLSMLRALRHLARAVFARRDPATTSHMKRRALVAAVLLLLLGAAGYGVYWWKVVRADAAPDAPKFVEQKPALAADEFEQLARTNPVELLAQCLSRYQREVTGARATVQKQERVQGKPAHPEMPPVEVIELFVRGDVPNPDTQKTAIEVLMKWKSGAKSFLGSEIRATLFSEKAKADGGLDGKVVTWRPEARFQKESFAVPPNNELAKGQSRYCIRDAGLYRTMLRTHTAWKARQEANEFDFEYLGKQTPEHIGRECLVIRRKCKGVEVDAFEVGGVATGKPELEGFTEVTIFVDAERRLQLGTELVRTEATGTRVLLGAYYFRDVQLNPPFAADTFTIAELKR